MRIFLISLVCIGVFTGCQKKPESAAVPAVPVSAIKIIPQTIPADFQYIGVAESSHIVELRARVEGYLEKIAYQEGALVQTGDLMFVIDQRPFLASLEMAKGELARQQAILWNAQQSKNRMVPLYEKNAVSQRDLDNAIADEMAAAANVLSAQANVTQAELNLSFTEVQSPVTGMASRAISVSYTHLTLPTICSV